VYSVTINGTVCSYTSDTSATTGEIIAGIGAAITAATVPITLIGLPSGIMTTIGQGFLIEAAVEGVDFSITANANVGVVTHRGYTAAIADTFDTIMHTDNDFYFVLLTSTFSTDILAIAAKIEPLTRMLCVRSVDTDIALAAVTTDIASQLAALTYDRTFLLHTSNASNLIDAAWIGIMASKDPGAATWKFKSGKSVTADAYSDTQHTAIKTKRCNLYNSIGGISVFEEGVVASGEYIDVMQGVDWMSVNIQADVYSALVNEDKISYTNEGIDAVKTSILAVLKRAVSMGILAADPAPQVFAPNVSDVAPSDKQSRLLPDITFTGTLAGAIHKTAINGKVSV
jgi:hypothetical protein